MSLAPNDPRHGTYTGYNNHRCRCEDCRAANTAACAEWRHRVGRSLPRAEYLANLRERADRSHGLSRYRRGCRCDLCREAMRLYQAGYRSRKRQEQAA